MMLFKIIPYVVLINSVGAAIIANTPKHSANLLESSSSSHVAEAYKSFSNMSRLLSHRIGDLKPYVEYVADTMDQKVAEHILAHNSPNVFDFAQVNVTAAGKVGGKKDEKANKIAEEVIQKHYDLDVAWVQLRAARDLLDTQTTFHDGVVNEKAQMQKNYNVYVNDCNMATDEADGTVEVDSSDLAMVMQDLTATQIRNSASHREMVSTASDYFGMWLNRDNECPGKKAKFHQNVSLWEAYKQAYLLNVAETAEFCKQAPSGMSFLATSQAQVPAKTPHFEPELNDCYEADVCHLQVPLYWSLMCGERFTYDETNPEFRKDYVNVYRNTMHSKKQLADDKKTVEERTAFCDQKKTEKDESEKDFKEAVEAQTAELKQLNDEYEAAKTAYTEAFDSLCSIIKLRKVMLMGLDIDPADLNDCDLPAFEPSTECEALLGDAFCAPQCGENNAVLCRGVVRWGYDIPIPMGEVEKDGPGSMSCSSYRNLYQSQVIQSTCLKLCAVDCVEYDTDQNPGFPLLPLNPTPEQCQNHEEVEVEYFTPPRREARYNGEACQISKYSKVADQPWLSKHNLAAKYPMNPCPPVISCNPQFIADRSFCSRGCARNGESDQILKTDNNAGCEDEVEDCANLADCPDSSLYCIEQRSVVMMLDKSQLFLYKMGDIPTSLSNVAQLTRSILGRLLYKLPLFDYTLIDDLNFMFQFRPTALMDVRIATYGLFPPPRDTDEMKTKYDGETDNQLQIMADLEDYCIDKTFSGFFPAAAALTGSNYLDILHQYETILDTPGLNNAHEIHNYMAQSNHFKPATKHKNTLLIIGGSMVLGEKYMQDNSNGAYNTYVIGIKTDENQRWSSNILNEPTPESTFLEVKSFAGVADQIDDIIHMLCMRVTESSPNLFLMSENVVYQQPTQVIGMSTDMMNLGFKIKTCIRGSATRTVSSTDGSLWHYLDSRIRNQSDPMSTDATYTVAMEPYSYMNQYDAFNLWSGKIEDDCGYKLFLHFESVKNQESILLPYIYSALTMTPPPFVKSYFTPSSVVTSLADFEPRDGTEFEEPEAGGAWKVSLLGYK